MTRVILVDDDPEVASVLCKLVEHCGAKVVGLFYNGRQAADFLLPLGEEWLTVADMIISDNDMPEMTGMDLFYALRERGASIPFTLLSGRGIDQAEEDKARLCGGAQFVLKPITMETMRKLVLG